MLKVHWSVMHPNRAYVWEIGMVAPKPYVKKSKKCDREAEGGEMDYLGTGLF